MCTQAVDVNIWVHAHCTCASVTNAYALIPQQQQQQLCIYSCFDDASCLLLLRSLHVGQLHGGGDGAAANCSPPASSTSPVAKTAPVVMVTDDDTAIDDEVAKSMHVIRQLEQGRPAMPRQRPVSPIFAALQRSAEDDAPDDVIAVKTGGHHLAVSSGGSAATSPVRSVSPTLLAVLEEEKRQQQQQQQLQQQPGTQQPQQQPMRRQLSADGAQEQHVPVSPKQSIIGLTHEPGEASKQSRSFRMLQAEVGDNAGWYCNPVHVYGVL